MNGQPDIAPPLEERIRFNGIKAIGLTFLAMGIADLVHFRVTGQLIFDSWETMNLLTHDYTNSILTGASLLTGVGLLYTDWRVRRNERQQSLPGIQQQPIHPTTFPPSSDSYINVQYRLV